MKSRSKRRLHRARLDLLPAIGAEASFHNKDDVTGNKPLLMITDISTVAIDVSVFASDRARPQSDRT